ncbi:MAG: SBBP repeat-containing protein [Acidobacteriota bacterium]
MSYARYYRFFATLTLVAGLVLTNIVGQLGAITTVHAGKAKGQKKLYAPNPSTPLAVPEEITHQAAKASAVEAFKKLPLNFEANQGQVSSSTEFLARGRGYTLFLADAKATLALRSAATNKPSLLFMSLSKSNPHPRVEGLNKRLGITNYLIGNDPNKWTTNVPNFAKVQYKSVYPGVDMVYYGNQQQLEYDFIVAPGADPKAIKLTFKGARQLRIDANGDLLLRTAAGELRQQKPFIYQEADGVKQEVAGRYVRTGKREVGFEVAEYNKSRQLVIDPSLSYTPSLLYSAYVGGNADDQINAIALDGGYAYVTGSTTTSISGGSITSTSFPANTGAHDTSRGGTIDAFVTKLDLSGNGTSDLIYSTYLGGSTAEVGYGIAVKNDYPYVVGYTTSTDFPTSMTGYQRTKGSSADAFVTKLDSSGTFLSYSTYLGGNGNDYGFGITVDSFANAHVTGETYSSNFPTNLAAQSSLSGTKDAFVTKLNMDGTGISFSTYLGGSGNEAGRAIVMSGGTPVVTGDTSSTDFPVTGSAYLQTFGGGNTDAFVTRVGSSSFSQSTYLGGSGDDAGFGIAATSNDILVTGVTSGSFPTTSGVVGTSFRGGGADAFVSKLPSNLSALSASTYLGGSDYDNGAAIAVDASGNVYVTGGTSSTDFDRSASPYQNSYGGGNVDAFMTKLNSTLTSLTHSTYLGGSGDDQGTGIASDSSGNSWIAGFTTGSFPTVSGGYKTTYQGGSNDGFVSKMQN